MEKRGKIVVLFLVVIVLGTGGYFAFKAFVNPSKKIAPMSPNVGNSISDTSNTSAQTENVDNIYENRTNNSKEKGDEKQASSASGSRGAIQVFEPPPDWNPAGFEEKVIFKGKNDALLKKYFGYTPDEFDVYLGKRKYEIEIILRGKSREIAYLRVFDGHTNEWSNVAPKGSLFRFR